MFENNISKVGAISKFNEGSFQMQRIHELQERINVTNLNPLFFYEDEMSGRGLFGYRIILNSLNSLFAEASSKLGTDEIEKGKRIRKKANVFLILNPIHENRINGVTHHQEVKTNEISWIKFKDILFEYELLIRKFLENHKMTSPTGDRPEDSAYR